MLKTSPFCTQNRSAGTQNSNSGTQNNQNCLVGVPTGQNCCASGIKNNQNCLVGMVLRATKLPTGTNFFSHGGTETQRKGVEFGCPVRDRMLVENVSLSRYLLSREGQDIGRRSCVCLCPVRATDHSPGQRRQFCLPEYRHRVALGDGAR